MNIATIEQYLEQKNSWNQLFGEQPLSLMRAADRQRIADSLDAELSPENLTCDGEIRGAALTRKYNYLVRCAEELLSIDPNLVFHEYN